MRKNGVNRELLPVPDGVCAPAGFRANGVYCGIPKNTPVVSRETKSLEAAECEDLSLIVSEKRVPTACVYADSPMLGAPSTVTRKHVRSGYARAVIANSGIANVFLPQGEKLAESICVALGKRAKIPVEEIMIASTGEIGRELPLALIENKLDELITGLGATQGHSLKAARGIMTTDTYAKQLSFSFDIGDYSCKVGAIFKGNRRVCPNMATTLCFLTTDVNITPEMLQKALVATVGNTFNLLDLDGVSSPNDFLCIMASGLAGNAKIDRSDGEYKKFCYALQETLSRVCQELAKDGENIKKTLQCKVSGARSVRAARAVAKAVAGAGGLKTAISEGRFDLDTALCAICETGETLEVKNITVSVCSKAGELVVFEDGKAMPLLPQTVERALGESEVEVCVRLGNGNYTATAVTCV